MCNSHRRLQITSIAIVAISLPFATVAPAESSRTFEIAQPRNGYLTVDGIAITMADVDATFRDIAKQHGYVAYYREASDGSPDANTTEILRAGEKFNVAIELARKPDFSDIKPGKSEPAKAVMVTAPRPKYPSSARKKGLTGAGVFVLHLDPYSGIVKSVHTEKSTGVALLDHSAITAFQRWRFKPNGMWTTRVKIPITFTQTGAANSR